MDLVTWLPISLPGILVGIGLMWLFLGTPIFRPFYGSIVLLIIATSGMPLGTQVIKSNLVQIGADLEDASMAAGACWWMTYRRIVLPLMTPVLVIVAIVNFIAAARDISHIVLLVAESMTQTIAANNENELCIAGVQALTVSLRRSPITESQLTCAMPA